MQKGMDASRQLDKEALDHWTVHSLQRGKGQSIGTDTEWGRVDIDGRLLFRNIEVNTRRHCYEIYTHFTWFHLFKIKGFLKDLVHSSLSK